MLIFVWICIGLLTWHWAASETIDPSRIQVATVLDVASPQITRDSFTLIRSLRLHGGTLNKATLTVYIPIASKDYFFDADELISKLAALNVEVDFIDQTLPPSPRTLNKFAAWQMFDYHRFDYLLWLDADIFVMADPIPLLQRVPRDSRQTLMCAPELYSYMQRFPHVNETNLFANPNLSLFRLLGQAEIVPHGVCNTGVIFIERSYLQAFLYELPKSMSEIDAKNPYTRDRFLDSLYFVRTVHRVGKPLGILPYDLNFMTNFETEIQEEIPSAIPVLVHHLFNTEIKCEESPGNQPSCICVYNNDNRAKDSYIIEKLNEIVPWTCESMVGKLDTELGNTSRQISDGLISHLKPKNTENIHVDGNNEHNDYNIYGDKVSMNARGEIFDADAASSPCQLIVPQWHSLIRVSSQQHRSQEIYLECREPVVELSVSCTISPIRQRSISNEVTGEIEAFEALNFERHKMNASTYLIRSEYFPLSSCSNAYLIEAWMQLKITIKTRLKTGVECYITQSPIKLVINQLLPIGLVNYQGNLLLGATPLALASQIYLSGILNDRNLVRSGLIMCCDTSKGISTVHRIINDWEGEVLIIVLLTVPKRLPGIDSLRIFLQNACKSSSSSEKLKCVIKLESSSPLSVLRATPQKSLSFFYTDVYSGIGSYKSILLQAFDKIIIHGIMMGSRYITDWRESFFLAQAVDDFVTIHIPTPHSVFVTFHESSHQCSVDSDKNAENKENKDDLLRLRWCNLDVDSNLNAAPAWYVLKEIHDKWGQDHM